MTATLLSVLIGVVVVLAVTALTGYFVAQEFGFVSVDRSRLRTMAETGDDGARRALTVTSRTSFMLSGAQLGITVTGLVVGYVAEPMIGSGVAELLGVTDLPAGLLAAIGAALALLLATVIQMVFGELVPKNYAIARPEATARALALSTTTYLALFGWLIRFFDGAANRLLRALGIEPVHDVDEAATASDLEAIIDTSRDSGSLPEDLSLLLDRVLDFGERSARSAMIPRPDVATVPAGQPLAELVTRMSREHSNYPVVGDSPDDVLGVVHLRDVLALPESEQDGATAGSLARPAMFVPDTLHLPDLLEQMRAERQQLACVLDEFGGLAGIVTVEDVAEELVGEISDEHDEAEARPFQEESGWIVPGALSVEETERLLDHDLPHGAFTTVGGLIVDRLNRLARSGDVVILDLSAYTPRDWSDPAEDQTADDAGPGEGVGGARPGIGGASTETALLQVSVLGVKRRVPATLRLHWITEDGRPCPPPGATDGRADHSDGEAAP